MPQMSPLNWLSLYTFFFIIFLMFNIINFFIFKYPSPSHSQKSLMIKKLNWKW
uniref:ATP synthase complex subunit 8 n=1 Tax=Curculionoidea sp. 24 KM-2017 TaxID=2219408 RepID=A0A346RKJ6_9CUCU|nr:ATP synthase F0 subunit 8 [Curculionoidea sp. 24 KM-2017]